MSTYKFLRHESEAGGRGGRLAMSLDVRRKADSLSTLVNCKVHFRCLLSFWFQYIAVFGGLRVKRDRECKTTTKNFFPHISGVGGVSCQQLRCSRQFRPQHCGSFTAAQVSWIYQTHRPEAPIPLPLPLVSTSQMMRRMYSMAMPARRARRPGGVL